MSHVASSSALAMRPPAHLAVLRGWVCTACCPASVVWGPGPAGSVARPSLRAAQSSASDQGGASCTERASDLLIALVAPGRASRSLHQKSVREVYAARRKHGCAALPAVGLRVLQTPADRRHWADRRLGRLRTNGTNGTGSGQAKQWRRESCCIIPRTFPLREQ